MDNMDVTEEEIAEKLCAALGFSFNVIQIPEYSILEDT